jgi:hypothetical protein
MRRHYRLGFFLSRPIFSAFPHGLMILPSYEGIAAGVKIGFQPAHLALDSLYSGNTKSGGAK